MAKKMMTDIEDNCARKGNSKGFHKGEEPTIYGPGDGVETGGRRDGGTEYPNEVGAIPDPNGDKNKIYDKKLRTPREPVLNAVPMPNRTKMNKRDYSVLDYTGDEDRKDPAANVPIGGTPRPNHIS